MEQQQQQKSQSAIPRELWLRFFSVHSTTLQSPEAAARLRAHLESGLAFDAALGVLRADSFRALSIDPALGLAQLRQLPATFAVGAHAQGVDAAPAEVEDRREPWSTNGAASNGAASSGAAGGREEDFQLMCALCRLRAEEAVLLDELTLTLLAFAQKRMQRQIVTQQQLQFVENLSSLTSQQQKEYWNQARQRMEKERQRRLSNGVAQMSSRELWDVMAGNMTTGEK